MTAGSGVQISATGVLSINAADPTFNGFIKTNNLTAYNGYVWPNGPLPAKGQLQTDAAGNLIWGDADAIPWTTKGQLIVGTGIDTDTLFSPGVNTSLLQVDLTTGSGLIWSDSNTGAALLPKGNTAQRIPVASALTGQIRYNSSLQQFEGYQGPTTSSATQGWKPLSIQPVGPTDANGNIDTANNIFYYNSQTLSVNYTVAANMNALSAGTITLGGGVTVTIPATSSWTII